MIVISERMLRPIRAALAAAALLSAAGAGFAGDNGLCVAAPDFEAVTLENQRIALADLKGDKPVYLKFWLTTCPQCLAEMPHFTEAHEHYGDELQFVAINLSADADTPEVVRQSVAKFGLEMPVVVDEDGRLQSAFDVIGTPTHVVIDREGRIRHFGHAADETLDAALAAVHETAKGLP